MALKLKNWNGDRHNCNQLNLMVSSLTGLRYKWWTLNWRLEIICVNDLTRNNTFCRYNYKGKNACTITGKMKENTVETLTEPDGRWPCEQCPNIYTKQDSLLAHYRRNHNSKLKVPCPECPKMLSHKTALAKHLLSHRPEEQWPFQCQFCGKYFQVIDNIKSTKSVFIKPQF